ncbi:DUF1127 domain-containing protein [Agrobacterium sp. a22-2]|uniref:DUF1127 domain-containing protein n=1 Tax=Agrobacterium sp. a22-2 TaxID=2283840 RepID=UPI0014455DD9|nr:DUF1127 domain-containing protein [Agrobacterium sp. a22-2]NKN36548.1 DUF1127 domain-containing protein [Agrobacterium sp. a22-2]
MHKEHVIVVDDLVASVEALYQKFGMWRVVGAFVAAARRQRRTANALSDLSAHMLRDIGMPEEGEDFLLPRKPSLWDIRL